MAAIQIRKEEGKKEEKGKSGLKDGRKSWFITAVFAEFLTKLTARNHFSPRQEFIMYYQNTLLKGAGKLIFNLRKYFNILPKLNDPLQQIQKFW